MLKELSHGHLCLSHKSVLILILMEHAQREHMKEQTTFITTMGLNPYFNGTCSKRERLFL